MTGAGARVEVTPETCAGSGVCAFYASNTFELGDDGRVRLVGAGGDPEDDVRNAAEACPTHSIHLEPVRRCSDAERRAGSS